MALRASASGAETRPPRAAAPQPATIPGNAPLSPQERFSRDLYEHCKMINPSLAMWLNGSFEVLQMEGDVLELGFQRGKPGVGGIDVFEVERGALFRRGLHFDAALAAVR